MNHVDPLDRALQYLGIRQGFRIDDLPRGLIAGTLYSAVLNGFSPVRLTLRNPGSRQNLAPLSLVAAQSLEIVASSGATSQERFRVRLQAYTYTFFADLPERGNVELLTFHWRRERGNDPAPRRHLHIGPALIAEQQAVRPGAFHKAHIPIGRLPFEAIVRFAIEELGAQPRGNWRTILAAADADPTFAD